MSYLRSYSIKIAVLLLFVTGMLIVAWPAKDRTNNGESISNWLLDLRSDTSNPVVHNKISSLSNQDGDIPGLLRQATSIISSHQDDFVLPVNSGDASDDDIYNTLLIKWTLHQQEAAADTVTISDRQSQVPAATEKDNKSYRDQVTQSLSFVVGAYSRISEAWDYIRLILRPLVSGIAINAP